MARYYRPSTLKEDKEMARYQNKKNGRIAVVVEEDKKYKTVLLQYEDDESEQSVSSSTLKRWWEEVDDEDYDDDDEDYEEEEEGDEEEDIDGDDYDEDDEELDEEEEIDDDVEDEEEEIAGDGTPLKEVGKQIARQAKQKAEAAKKEKKKVEKKPAAKKEKAPRIDVTPYKEDILGIAEEIGFEPVEYEKLPGLVVLKAAGHGKVDLRLGQRKFSTSVKEVIAEESGLEYRTVKNYYLPAIIDFQYDSYKKDLKALLKMVYKAATAKKKEVK